MDVGAAGFGRLLPGLRDRVRSAAFLGDSHFPSPFLTLRFGFCFGSLFDSPAERYLKVRQSVQRFTGCVISCSHLLEIFSFHFRYVVHSYNFFLFPSTLGVTDVEFTLSASSIQFLSHYGFDFNKFLKDGIPYMNEVQEESLSQRLSEGSWRVCSAVGRNVMKKAIDEVTRWIVAAEEGETMTLKDLSGTEQGASLGYQQALSGFITAEHLRLLVVVKKVSLQQRRLLENSSYDYCRKELILTSARGFTNLFQILVEAKKPLVGHNMFMDLCHLHDKFYKPLPESYEEFKRNIHNLFPVLIDTKTVTKSIWRVRCDAEKKSPHEAGYDAFLCGSGKMFLKRFLNYFTGASQFISCSVYCMLSNTCLYTVLFLVPYLIFLGKMFPANIPLPWLSCVRGWPQMNERQIYQELKALCRFDVRRLSENQFILLSNKFKHVRRVLRNYKHHPHLQISVYRHWRHSPRVNCLLQVSGIVALWSLLAFVLGGRPCCSS
uniref:PARN like, ribonuclease domain containing 1 n=1 Tax=Anas platyrhynchos TaxID=8839 RepID=A0A8B9TCI1_ANAPL